MEVKPKVPKGGSRELNQLACIAHPKLGKPARVRFAKGLRALQPKVQDQGSDQGPGRSCDPRSSSCCSSGSQRRLAPTKAPVQRPLPITGMKSYKASIVQHA
ncbi:hypothetical protein GH733_000225 [Mirounga leonina]|nr:hypothetical protein GH733_000225 [Mirounga leonina]